MNSETKGFDMFDDGGPAFPVNSKDVWNGISPAPGMTLRDYFASDAMKGWLASFGEQDGHPADKPIGASRCARLSYALADAMLAERRK